MFVSAWSHEGLSQVNFWVYNKGIEIFKIEKTQIHKMSNWLTLSYPSQFIFKTDSAQSSGNMCKIYLLNIYL